MKTPTEPTRGHETDQTIWEWFWFVLSGEWLGELIG